MTQFNRLPNGLVQDYPYQRSSDGRIDWKALLNTKWLRVKDDKKAEVEMRYGKKVRELDLSKIEDYYLYVTLGGYNEVARLRGFDKLNQHVDYVDGTKAVVTCTMRFIPNEEEPNGIECAGVASGSLYNISRDFAPFMETIAENRAFIRCVRRALNINIVGQEELGSDKAVPLPASAAQEESVGFAPYVLLSNRCKSLKISFDKLRERSVAIKDLLKSDPATWTDWKDIQENECFVLMTKINESAK